MAGKLYGIGVGPGDSELITLKALRLLRAAPVVAYPAPDDGNSFARQIVAPFLSEEQIEIPIGVPMRVERFPAQQVYDQAAHKIAEHLKHDRDVVVLCEGDPFFYGSFMYLYERLANEFECEIVPGVSSMMAGAAALGRPLAARNDILTVIPAPLSDDEIKTQLMTCQAAAIIKLGRHFERVQKIITEMDLSDQSGYLERISLSQEKIYPLNDVPTKKAPYFSMILIYKGAENWVSDLPVPNKGEE
jgi:precorrin-2/cobalt-factor-2 C20-methyltransferase